MSHGRGRAVREERRTDRFLYLLYTLGARPSWGTFFMFLFGWLSLSILADPLYGLAQAPDNPLIRVALVVLMVAALIGGAAWLYRRETIGLRRRIEESVDIAEEPGVAPRRGLIWMVSHNVGHAVFAIHHHYGARPPHTLERCWLLISEGNDELEARRRDLCEQLQDLGIDLKPETVYMPRPDIECAYRTVERIYREKLPAAGLSPSDVIADVTGGTKAMTAGMTLACVFLGLDLEYVESQYSAGERTDTGRRIVALDVHSLV